MNHPTPSQCSSVDISPVQALEDLYKRYSDAVFEWAFNHVLLKLWTELITLSQRNQGLHFHANNASVEYLKGSFMQEAAVKMKKVSLWTWKLMQELLDANCHQFCQLQSDDRLGAEQVAVTGLGGAWESRINDKMVEDASTGGIGESKHQTKKERKAERARAQNAALIVIKSVVCISIFLQSTNQRCNFLQSILGIFYHSTSVPEKVIETLAHTGLSVALMSIHLAIKSLSHEASIKLHNSIHTLTMGFAYNNFDITFWVAEPILGKDTTFVGAISATTIPLHGLGDTDNLCCSVWLWERDPNNPFQPQIITIDKNNLL